MVIIKQLLFFLSLVSNFKTFFFCFSFQRHGIFPRTLVRDPPRDPADPSAIGSAVLPTRGDDQHHPGYEPATLRRRNLLHSRNGRLHQVQVKQ